MATIPHTAVVASPDGTLKLQTSIVNHGNEADLPVIGSNEDTTLSSTIPELIRFWKDREIFRKIFEDSMENKRVKHKECFVLLLSWEDTIDDLKVRHEVEELKKIFVDLYGFDVTWETLRDQAGDETRLPKHQLNQHLSTFMGNHDKENTLLIFYYAGHGVYLDDSVHWQPKTSLQTKAQMHNRVAWSGAESCITPSLADVLVIFDCCEAGGYGDFQVPTRSSRPNFEFIAACGVKERTRHPGPESFTSALMWALKELQPLSPFTSISLVEKVKMYPHLPKTQTPELRHGDEFPDSLVWMAPLLSGPEPEAVGNSEHRNIKHEYFDLRFNFYRRAKPEDARNMARHLSKLIKKEEDTFAAKQITLLDISSTLSNAVRALTPPSMSSKRKYISNASPFTRKHLPDHLEGVSLPFAKRQRRELVRTIPTREVTENQGALYHLRMFFHCSLQTLGSGIGRVADQVHPPILSPEIATDSLDDRKRVPESLAVILQ